MKQHYQDRPRSRANLKPHKTNTLCCFVRGYVAGLGRLSVRVILTAVPSANVSKQCFQTGVCIISLDNAIFLIFWHDHFILLWPLTIALCPAAISPSGTSILKASVASCVVVGFLCHSYLQAMDVGLETWNSLQQAEGGGPINVSDLLVWFPGYTTL